MSGRIGVIPNDKLERAAKCLKACDGLPEAAFDGGWTVKGLTAYARGLDHVVRLLCVYLVQAGSIPDIDSNSPIDSLHAKAIDALNPKHEYDCPHKTLIGAWQAEIPVNQSIAIKYKDNWDGQGDISLMIARFDGKQWRAEESGGLLLQHVGDEILEWWPLTPGTGEIFGVDDAN